MTRGRWRRRGRWIGPILIALFGAAFWYSREHACEWIAPSDKIIIDLRAGAIGAYWKSTIRWNGPPQRGFRTFRHSTPLHWKPWARNWGFCLPLWIPLTLLAALTAWGWLPIRPYPPGRCMRCGYDLTGNTTGRCPECGSAPKNP